MDFCGECLASILIQCGATISDQYRSRQFTEIRCFALSARRLGSGNAVFSFLMCVLSHSFQLSSQKHYYIL